MSAPAIPVLVTGDDFALPVNLTINAVAQDVSGADIKARIVSPDHASAYSETVTQSSSAAGADWAAGKIVAAFSAAQTAAIATAQAGIALIEIQVDSGGLKATWWTTVMVVPGLID